ncbi:MAG: DUF1501 domain-containing protein [Isosphaeraceae bacterium]
MWTFQGNGARLCDGWTRREVLRAGGLGLLGSGLNLSALLRATEAGPSLAIPPAAGFGRAKSCIVLFLLGGATQHSTWDPKPDAPAEVRGPYGPIDTNVPGIRFAELMPQSAAIADKLCILRAVSTGDNAHSSSGYYMMTGRPHAPKNVENVPIGAPNDAPCLPAMARHLMTGSRGLPAGVTLPQAIFNTGGIPWPGQDAGFLGRSNDPWLLRGTPGPEGLQVDEVALPDDLDPSRIGRRRALLDRLARTVESPSIADGLDRHARQAFELLGSPEARRAFRTDLEPAETRDRYGRSPFGQSALLARRLVEAGVRLVQVNWYRGADEPDANPCWDTHVDDPKRLKEVLVPPTDRALSALIRDLDGRGLLDETLVVCMSEFGRGPKIEGNGGRGHWGSVFSVAMAGGGVRGGQVHGASDAFAAQPKDGKVTPEDLSATIFHALGIPPETELRDRVNRPIPVSRGDVIPILG